MSQQFIGIPLGKHKAIFLDCMMMYFIALIIGFFFYPFIGIVLFILTIVDPIRLSAYIPTSPILYFDDSD